MPQVIVYMGSDEWSALYVDGKLELVGDHYLSDERIRSIFGVETILDDAFMRGGNQRSDVAKTLDELHAWKSERDDRLARAAELRAEAARLEEEATQLGREGHS